jgi:hypothetical protein
LVVVKIDRGGHHSLAVAGDAVSAGSGDFCHEPVAAQFDDQPRDALASSMGFVAVDRRSPVEAVGDVGVAEPADRVFSGEYRAE